MANNVFLGAQVVRSGSQESLENILSEKNEGSEQEAPSPASSVRSRNSVTGLIDGTTWVPKARRTSFVIPDTLIRNSLQAIIPQGKTIRKNHFLDWKLEENQQLKRDGGRKKSTGWINVAHLSQHDDTYNLPSAKNESNSPTRRKSQAVGLSEPKKANALDNILKNSFSHDVTPIKPRASTKTSFQESVD